MTRMLRALVALLLAGAGTLVVSSPAQAAACTGTSGVTVVVQSDSGTSVRCAQGDPGSGMAALAAAGFDVTQVQRFPGAVCRINGVPASDPCVNMPPASAYWSYWHAPAGGSWSYSQLGAASYDPAPGTVEGWRFGSGQAPSTAPPSVPEPAPAPPAPAPAPPAPAPAQPAPAAPAPAAPGSGGGGAPTTAGGSATSTGPGPTGESPAPSSSATATASETPSPSASGSASASTTPSTTPSAHPTQELSAAPTAARTTSSSPVGVIVGAGLILLLGTIAFVGRQRRRNS